MKQKVYPDHLLEIIKDMGRARFSVPEGREDLEKLPDFVIIDPMLNEEPRKEATMAKKPKPKPKPKC